MNFRSLRNIACLLLISSLPGLAQTPVTITIDLTKTTIPVSPFIYGKNNVLPNTFLNSSSKAEITKAKEAGVRFVRQGGGNNSTKYNWRLKLSSHPDWYNNVYANDWDAAAKNMFDEMPGVHGMWSFQLIGKAAGNTKNNFSDWSYNQSKWWEGVNQNLAGGGQVNPTGTKALKEGNPDLYLIDWPADSTVGILDKWFGSNGLGYEKNKLRYWNMDNEPEIWSGTHDDVMKIQLPAEEFMQLYFKVAKAARAKFPDIKLVGPVPANEWQWYRWGNGISSGGRSYPWLEYFIKRIAEEEKASGIKLLDVLDIHYYPSSADAAQCVQYHRVFFDRNYIYPEANGVYTSNGGWDTSLKKEYILGRCADWLNQYMGNGNGVGLAVTECGLNSKNSNVQAVWYASTMGEFMKNRVEIFTPWSWDIGMWEVLHLFSRYNKPNYVQAASTDDTQVSAYPTISNLNDSLTVVLVNRSLTGKRTVNLQFNGFLLGGEKYEMYSLSNLPATETFSSRTKNALVKSELVKSGNQLTIELAPLSVNTILLRPMALNSIPTPERVDFQAKIFPNPASDHIQVSVFLPEKSKLKIELMNIHGQLIRTICNSEMEAGNRQIGLNLDTYRESLFLVKISTETKSKTIKLIKHH